MVGRAIFNKAVKGEEYYINKVLKHYSRDIKEDVSFFYKDGYFKDLLLDDFIQECTIKVYHSILKSNQDEWSFRYLIKIICKNTMFDYYKNTKLNNNKNNIPIYSDLINNYSHDELNDYLFKEDIYEKKLDNMIKLSKKLKGKEKKVFNLRLKGVKYSKICTKLKISESNVIFNLKKAKSQLIELNKEY